MNEQKYDVKLKKEFQATGVTFADMPLYLDENGAFDLKYFAHSFTKLELAEIKDGALYRVCNRDETFGLYPHVCDIEGVDCTEWINPLIELVPVEEEE